jgi:benzil reductase ((S)-benzoin forming)
MRFDLTIITGASRGMGLAMAEQLLQPQSMLLCISRQINPALEQEALKNQARLTQWGLDLVNSTEAAKKLHTWIDALPIEHIQSATLINNACVIPGIVPLHAAEPNDLAHALRVGLEAPMLLTAAFLNATRHWAISKKVLNISSGLGRRAMASQSAYCAVKAGLDHFTRCLALDEALQPNSARVCALAPGVIDTDMQVQLRHADAAQFPDVNSFSNLYNQGQLTPPTEAAKRVLNYLNRSDFGEQPVADVRH